MESIKNKRFAILATDGVEESEILEPMRALEEAGAAVDVVAPKAGEILTWKAGNWGQPLPVDKTIREAVNVRYDGLVLPGGVINADHLRTEWEAVKFVRGFAARAQPIASICHGAWILIETGYVKGHTITSWPSLKSDLENAGATWVNEEAVLHSGWVSSRMPADLPAFNRRMLEEFSREEHTDNPVSVMQESA